MGLTPLFIGLLLFPWISAMLIAIISNIPKSLIATFSILLSLVQFIGLAYFVFQSNGNQASIHIDWFTLGDTVFRASFEASSSAQLVALLVALVAFFVQIFSSSYLKDEANLARYYLYLHLFAAAMFGLLFADQIWIFYASWEMVGACSYLLISFWYQKNVAIQAAKKAFLLNRFGDIGLLIGLIGLSIHFNTMEFSGMQIGSVGPAPIAIGIALLAGAIGKSAQFPLMSWLPDAMEGPTPASALIHAATMVAAGVYLGIKIYPITGEDTHLFMAAIGAISLVSGAVFALFQNDIKKALAYSTISQLGLMWMGMGSDASLLHLVVHGIFKAGLFLSAGSVIHYLHHQKSSRHLDAQSLNQMGGLRKVLPWTALGYGVFAAGLMGLPFTNGFYSKENLAGFLWENAQNSPFYPIYWTLLACLGVGMFLSNWYISRQFYLIFLGKNRAQLDLEKPKKQDIAQHVPVLLLALFSLFFWTSTQVLHAEDSWLLHWFQIKIIDVPGFWLVITVCGWVMGITLTWLSRHWVPTKNYQFWPAFWPSIFQFIPWKARWTNIIDSLLLDRFLIWLAQLQVVTGHIIAWIDQSLVDGILVGFSTRMSQFSGQLLSKWQSGKVQQYWILVFLTFGLFLLYIWM
ncbi:NADH-quinone oxidoreductase subunit 5 family protein [Aquirufa aurantiipilula]